ncbi:MAG TPA: hypothetical protein VFM55_02340 [Micromonosporaceae bacterium]|nr:hypothetical protein [Micromonosporaceae bacterium]
MRRPQLIVRLAALLAVIVGGAIAFALPAGADVSVMSPPLAGVQIGSPATLVAKGAAISVPVTVICAPGGTGQLYVEVTQRSGGNIATGATWVYDISCTGSFQTIDVVVSASGEPFRKATALVSARFTVCEYWYDCLTGTDQREIQVGR